MHEYFQIKKIWLVCVEYFCAQKCNNINITKMYTLVLFMTFSLTYLNSFLYLIIKFDELISQIAKIYKEGNYNLGMWAEYALQSSIFMHSRNATYQRNTMINCNNNWHETYFSSLSKYFVPLKTSCLVYFNFFSNIRFTYFQCHWSRR